MAVLSLTLYHFQAFSLTHTSVHNSLLSHSFLYIYNILSFLVWINVRIRKRKRPIQILIIMCKRWQCINRGKMLRHKKPTQTNRRRKKMEERKLNVSWFRFVMEAFETSTLLSRIQHLERHFYSLSLAQSLSFASSLRLFFPQNYNRKIRLDIALSKTMTSHFRFALSFSSSSSFFRWIKLFVRNYTKTL